MNASRQREEKEPGGNQHEGQLRENACPAPILSSDRPSFAARMSAGAGRVTGTRSALVAAIHPPLRDGAGAARVNAFVSHPLRSWFSLFRIIHSELNGRRERWLLEKSRV